MIFAPPLFFFFAALRGFGREKSVKRAARPVFTLLRLATRRPHTQRPKSNRSMNCVQYRYMNHWRKRLLPYCLSCATLLTVKWCRPRNTELINSAISVWHQWSDLIRDWRTSSCTKSTPVMDCCSNSFCLKCDRVRRTTAASNSRLSYRLSGINDGTFVLPNVYDKPIIGFEAIWKEKCSSCSLSLELRSRVQKFPAWPTF